MKPTSLIHFLQRLEDALLVSLFVSMMLVAVVQIVVRNLIGAGIVWADPLVRILVLWAGLVGSMTATRQNSHISIDILTRFLPERFKLLANSLTLSVTSAVCGAGAWYSTQFVLMEREFGTEAFASVPIWVCESIIPIAFFVIAVRCLVLSAVSLKTSLRPEP